MELLKRGYDHLREKGVVEFSSLALGFLARRVRFVLWDRYGLGQFEKLYGSEYYERYLDPVQVRDAEGFNDAVRAEFDVDSVIDFGCGAGRFLLGYHERGSRVLGLDNHRDALEMSPLPRDRLERHDLRKPYHPPERFDIAYCIEVLEHIPDQYADTVVASIERSAPVAVVTAATPGQRGTLHVNEAPRSAWIDRFESHGFAYDGGATRRIREAVDPEKSDYLVENLMVFESADARG